MKKLLILAGASVHVKLVNVAKRMGIYTIVADYLEDSPAKLVADEAWLIDIFDVEALAQKCIEEKVDGVLSCYIDPCQRPYQELCQKLGLPCYGSKDQFYKMSDKHAFKKLCVENNVDVIPEFDIDYDEIEFPVFVKPVDSRGSRGQSVCYTRAELHNAIEYAKSESSNGNIIIEKYITNAKEFQVTYLFENGNPYLLRTTDSYTGPKALHLEKVVSCAVSPSKYTSFYIENIEPNVLKMFKRLGVKNGPIFMQGFIDEDKIRFFDPGLRFPGVDYDLVYEKVFNVSIMERLINFALSGEIKGNGKIPDDGYLLSGNRAAVLFPNVKSGVIKSIEGVNDCISDENIVSLWLRYKENDTVNWDYNINQRIAEIDVIGEDTQELKNIIQQIQSRLSVLDVNDNEMIYNLFDVSRIE